MICIYVYACSCLVCYICVVLLYIYIYIIYYIYILYIILYILYIYIIHQLIGNHRLFLAKHLSRWVANLAPKVHFQSAFSDC